MVGLLGPLGQWPKRGEPNGSPLRTLATVVQYRHVPTVSRPQFYLDCRVPVRTNWPAKFHTSTVSPAIMAGTLSPRRESICK